MVARICMLWGGGGFSPLQADPGVSFVLAMVSHMEKVGRRSPREGCPFSLPQPGENGEEISWEGSPFLLAAVSLCQEKGRGEFSRRKFHISPGPGGTSTPPWEAWQSTFKQAT